MMKKLVVFLILFFFFCTSSLKAETASFPEVALKALELVNALRTAPFETLHDLGLTEEEIRSLWEERELARWYEGLPLLVWNESLAETAHKHLEDMLAHSYLGHVSSDGLIPEERAAQNGYEALIIGESQAFLLFEHYLPPEEALKALLRNLIEDAFKRLSAEGAPLLFPPYEDLGAALIGGKLNFDGREYNFYALCLEFGLPRDTARPVLVGRVYRYTEENFKAHPDNALANIYVRVVEDTNILARAFSYGDGSFYMKNPPLGTLYFALSDRPSGPKVEWRVRLVPRLPYRLDFGLKNF